MKKALKHLSKILIIENRLYKNLSNDITQYYDYCALTYYLSEYFKKYSFYLFRQYKYKSKKALKELLVLVSKYEYSLATSVTWNGLIGLLYIMKSLNEEGQLDCKIQYLDNLLKRELSKLLLNSNFMLNNTDYDIISGLAGIGLYYVYSDDVNIDIPKKITYRLIDMLETIDILNLHDLHAPTISIIANPQIDYSISHGILGVMYYLSIYYKKTGDEYVLKVLKQSLNIYIKFLLDEDHNHITKFPSISKYVDGSIQFYYSSRTVWCYGSIGSFRGLYLIAENINYNYLKKLVLDEVKKFRTSDISEYNLICPTFCHGLSGVYLILSLFNSEVYDVYLEDMINKLEDKIWSYYDSTLPYCFPKYDDNGKGLRESIYDNSSFVGGAVSIALSYLLNQHINVENNYFMYSLALDD